MCVISNSGRRWSEVRNLRASVSLRFCHSVVRYCYIFVFDEDLNPTILTFVDSDFYK